MAIIILVNVITVAGTFFYRYASTCLFTSVAAILRFSPFCRLLFRLVHFLVSIVAVVVNLATLVPIASTKIRLRIIAVVVVAVAPLGASYINVDKSPKVEWDYSCDGFDATISLYAHDILIPALSYAQLPPSMGGEKWTLMSRSGFSYMFGAVGDIMVTFYMENKTYVLHDSTDEGLVKSRWIDEPLSFSDLDLQSTGQGWINACDWPSVTLKNSSGNVIIKSGLSWHRDLARMRVCASKSLGMDAIAVVVGRILIALEHEVNRCCIYYDDGNCITKKGTTITYIRPPRRDITTSKTNNFYT